MTIDRVGFSCLLLKGRGLATSSRFGDDWLLHHMPWSSYLQTAHCIQICHHSIRPPPLRFNNKQLKPTRSIQLGETNCVLGAMRHDKMIELFCLEYRLGVFHSSTCIRPLSSRAQSTALGLALFRASGSREGRKMVSVSA